MSSAPVTIGLNAVIVAVTDESPRVLTVWGAEHSLASSNELVGLPFGPLDPEKDRTLDRGLRGWVRTQTGLELGYVEQLYTFGDRHRDPVERRGGPRVISVAYLALSQERHIKQFEKARWCDYYEFFPWEDWRQGAPSVIGASIIPGVKRWIEAAGTASERRRLSERVAITFGLEGASWDSERVLERYELLYEAGLVEESFRDHELYRDSSRASALGSDSDEPASWLGRPMTLDHRRMLATALGRLRGKIKYRPVIFELLPESFTLFQLQRVVESLAGVRLHKQNFRRLVDAGGLVEGTGELDRKTGGRPAELFRFRREVLRERKAPGVGLPLG